MQWAARRYLLERYRPAVPPRGDQDCVQRLVDYLERDIVNPRQTNIPVRYGSGDNDPQINTAIAMAAAMAEMSRVATNFSVYEQRQFRMFDSAVKRLEARSKASAGSSTPPTSRKPSFS